jgi:hypothetical protein
MKRSHEQQVADLEAKSLSRQMGTESGLRDEMQAALARQKQQHEQVSRTNGKGGEEREEEKREEARGTRLGAFHCPSASPRSNKSFLVEAMHATFMNERRRSLLCAAAASSSCQRRLLVTRRRSTR